MLGADMNMGVFNAVEQMQERGGGLTLLNHHCELPHPSLLYDKNSVSFDAMGVWIVGPFSIQTSRILSQVEHIFRGAAHPKCEGQSRRLVATPPPLTSTGRRRPRLSMQFG